MAKRLSSCLLVAATLTVTPAWAQAVNRASNTPAAAAPSAKWTTPRTPDGQPDLQGIWDYRTATPLERPKELGDRAFLTDDEIAEFERRATEREDGRPPEDGRSGSVGPSAMVARLRQESRRHEAIVLDHRSSRRPGPSNHRRGQEARCGTAGVESRTRSG